MKRKIKGKLITMLICGVAAALSACVSQTGSEMTTIEKESTTQEETELPKEQGRTVMITHDQGTVEVPFNPQRVAILDMSVLDMLDAWGLGDRVVGIPKQSEVGYLLSYNENSEIAHLGSLKEVDMETLNSLEPDVIFIGGRLRSEYENISKIAPTVLSTINNETGYMAGFKENVEVMASIFGMEQESEAMLSGLDARIEVLKQEASEKTAIVGMVTSSSFNTLGKGARCSIISNEVGFDNLADDVNSTHGDSSSFELLLDKNPDYIFVLDRDTAINATGSKTAKQVMENEIVMKTKAYQEGQIIFLTPDVWYLAEGGITATDIMLKDLEQGILY